MKDMNPSDLIGGKFGHLEVVDFVGVYREGSNPVRKRYVYLCRCDCGRYKAIRRDSLLQKVAQSCGHTNGRYDSIVDSIYGKENKYE